MGWWQAQLFVLAFYAVLAARPVYRALTAGRPARVREWAALQGLPLTTENEAVVASYLRRSRRWRVAGAFVGVVIGPVLPRVSGEYGGMAPLVTFITGYLAGVLAGEFAIGHEFSGSRRRASLSPRRLEEYVLPGSFRWIGWGVAATALTGIAFLALPRHDSFVTPVDAVAAIAMAVAFAVGARALGQLLLQRSQPLGSPLAMATDDAIRSSGIRAVVAAGAAMVLVSLAFECWALATTDVQVLRWTMWEVSLLVLGCALGAWRTLVDAASWRVPRRGPATGNVA